MIAKFAKRRRRTKRPPLLRDTTIRDFSGGLNVIDNELNLSSRFSTELDNIRRDVDGSQALRYGTRWIKTFTALPNSTGTVPVTNPFRTLAAGSTKVRVNWPSHGFIAGHTVTFAGAPSTIDGIPAANFNTTHSVFFVEDEDNFQIIVATTATAGSVTGGGAAVTYSFGNKNMAGDVIDFRYFQDRLVIVDDTGVIIESDSVGNSRVIWNNAIAGAVGYLSATSNSLTTGVGAGSEKLRWTKTAHGLVAGSQVTFRGAAGFDGVAAASINTTLTVETVIDANTVEFDTNDPCTAGGVAGGGTAIEYTLSPITGWGTIDFCSFAVFNGKLTIHNGIDKPVEINLSRTRPCDYLVDAATGSNYNVPIGRYALAMDDYLLIGGIVDDPLKIAISSFGTSGTWEGDPAPNDATTVNIGQVVSTSNPVIRGLSRFRDQVVVALEESVCFGTLGTYDEADVHVPKFGDEVTNHGAVSHRTMINLGNDLFMADNIGVPSINRARFTGDIRPDRVSQLIDPEIQASIRALNIDATSNRVFAVYNKTDGEYMLFIPNDSVRDDVTETICYTFKFIPSLKITAWSRFRGWNWDAAASTLLGRIYFMRGKKLYVYGAQEDPIYADRIDDPDITDPDLGDTIDFVWELPWADFDARVNNKTTRYIAFDTKGTAQFTAKMFVDNIYKDSDGELDPAIEVNFTGGDSPGYGGGEQPFGGGRRTSDPRLWNWPAKFQIMKLRFEGSARTELRFISITLFYLKGSIRR